MGVKNKLIEDLSGKRFGSLLVKKSINLGLPGRLEVECECDCGTVKIFQAAYLLRGELKSCGCRQLDGIKESWKKTITHGSSKRGPFFRTYRAWRNMIERCKYDYDATYDGVTVCEEWQNFENFLRDMGQKPEGRYSIDRNDSSKGYFKENCRWATDLEQQNNRCNNIRVFYKGKVTSAGFALREIGIPENSIEKYRKRIRRLQKSGKPWRDALWDFQS